MTAGSSMKGSTDRLNSEEYVECLVSEGNNTVLWQTE